MSNSNMESDSQYDNVTKHVQAPSHSTTPRLNRTGHDGVQGEVRQNIHTPQKVTRSSSTWGSLSPITPTPKGKAKKPREWKSLAVKTTTRTLRSRNTQCAGS